MAINVKEIKKDSIIEVKVNTNYYMMLKNTLYYIFNQFPAEQKEESLKKITTGDYAGMNEIERAFFTLSIMVAEIERVAKEQKVYEDKQVLQPGDEGYVEPTIVE